MKNLLFHICILFLTRSCNTKTSIPESKPNNESTQINIDDSTVYSAVTYLFKNKLSNPFLKYKKVLETAEMPFYLSFSTDSVEIVKLDSIFTSKDMEYMQAQKINFINLNSTNQNLTTRQLYQKIHLTL